MASVNKDMKESSKMQGRFRVQPLFILILLSIVSAFSILCRPGGELRAESPDDILVVGNNGLGLNSISLEDLKDIFLKNRTILGGNKVVPVNALADSWVRKVFRERVLGMSASEEGAYWVAEQVKSGVAPPSEFANTLKAVFKIKGGISYVRRSDYISGTAKILLVIPAR